MNTIAEPSDFDFQRDKESHRKAGINPNIFYGCTQPKSILSTSNQHVILPPQLNPRFLKLAGPSTVWKTFKKQCEILKFISSSNCGLLPFVVQVNDGSRVFLAADPVTFWYVDEQLLPNERHSYEIIQDTKKCKLYFDLEFDKEANTNQDGVQKVQIFINFVCFALLSTFNVHCSSNDVLNLDSSTPVKFSCHLIFPDVVFKNNYQAGCFVKQLCHEIRCMPYSSELCMLKNCSFSVDDAKLLIIGDRKGGKKLFCDESVYSKNRHFRLYKSSKFGKDAVLKVSNSNLLKAHQDDTAMKEEMIFLKSLITYCSAVRIIEYDPVNFVSLKHQFPEKAPCETTLSSSIPSPYPEIDRCVCNIAFPGRIYRSKYFASTKTIIYDIVGNRFCENIGRPHKSNNIKYVVDVSTLSYYQSCYDPDCAGFKSTKHILYISGDFFINHNIDDDLLLSVEEFDIVSASKLKAMCDSKDSAVEDQVLARVAEKVENEIKRQKYRDQVPSSH